MLLLFASLCAFAQEVDGVYLLPDDLLEEADSTVVLTDSMAVAADSLDLTDSAAEATVAVEVPDYMLRSVLRSWKRANPLKSTTHNRSLRGSYSTVARRKADSLKQSIDLEPLQLAEMQYLYDMRLPIISAGFVPSDSAAPFHLVVDEIERKADQYDLPVSHPDELFSAQLRNEEQRHLARFNYASVDPRRFRYARREFDVPTSESRTIDTKTTAQSTRLVDDIDIDFGKADLETFGQYFSIKADRWYWKGDHSLTMQQTALTSNWYNGGDNNMSVSGEQRFTVNRYDENSKVTFEGVFDIKLSGYYTKADTIHRMRVSDNEFTLNLKYGYQAWKKWYYSAQLYAKTPIFDFYNANSRVCKSTFLSPLEMNLALGVDYKYTSPNKRFTYSLLLAPLSYDMKYVNDARVNPANYKIKEGDSSLHNFGSTITTKFDWKMSESASWSSRLYYFTTYHGIKTEFENTFNFKISRFFTARAYFYPRYDDSSDTKAEIKEMLTIGFNYAW